MEHQQQTDILPTLPKALRNPVRVIRQFCLRCVNGSPREVELCTDLECPLYPWRLGRNPYRKPPTEKQRESARRAAQEATSPLDENRGKS